MFRRHFLMGAGATAGLVACSQNQTSTLIAVSDAEDKLAALGIELPLLRNPLLIMLAIVWLGIFCLSQAKAQILK